MGPAIFCDRFVLPFITGNCQTQSSNQQQSDLAIPLYSPVKLCIWKNLFTFFKNLLK